MNDRMDQEVRSTREVRGVGRVGEGKELDEKAVGKEKEKESYFRVCIWTNFSGDHCETRHRLPPGSPDLNHTQTLVGSWRL